MAKPRGSKPPIFKDSGPKTMKGMVLEPEASNIGYWDPLGGQVPQEKKRDAGPHPEDANSDANMDDMPWYANWHLGVMPFISSATILARIP